MDKAQAYHIYWNGFTIPAYEENSIPDQAPMPYITYESALDNFDNQVALSVSLWYRSTSWVTVLEKLEEINQSIGRGGKMLKYEGGAMWLKRGTPFARRMGDASDDFIKRVVINVTAEYISNT